MPITGQSTILLSEVAKRFPHATQPAVSPLSIQLQGNVVIGLIGPDGAGKTTLLRMLAGLLVPSQGRLQINQLDPFHQRLELHHILGYMPQKFGLYEDLTVMENLRLYADLQGIDIDQQSGSIKQLLKFTNLSPFTQRLAGKLSGGMKQKLGLACTLIGKPQILLLDEPSVGVDPVSRRELWQMAHSLTQQGLLILWSTAYLDEAEQCHEVLLMNKGQLLYQGPPKALSQQMAGRSVLIQADPGSNRQLLQQAITRIEVTDGVIQGKYARLLLAPDVDREKLLQRLGQQAKFIDTPPRFEDAFIDLLGGLSHHQSQLAEILPEITKTADDYVIQTHQLTKIFGDFTAADKINLQVRRGEIFGLLGPNGAGKSTTFKMICGLLPPTSGTTAILGLDLKKHASAVRQRFGYMAQKFSLYGYLTVLQNLYFFSGIYGLKGKQQRSKIERMISTFNFHSILNQIPDALPPGFKQRLALACALMHEPAILFLDEPTSGVDPLTRREFWLHINSMVEKGVTVLVTTHFMDEAEYCDHIAFVYHGKIIATGSPDELKQQIVSKENNNPTMEQTFVELVQRYDLQKET